MANPKDILVITTSTIDGIKVKKYLKPITAHIVAGTNLFSDFFAGLTDVFGGRSQSYQKQLTSLYNEAIEIIKITAHELGANCIIGLSMDIDEISGKGKSMFMLTAIGTAVILENETIEKNSSLKPIEKFENVGVDRINILRIKKDITAKAKADNLNLNEDLWSFITANKVEEVFPFLLKIYSKVITNNETNQDESEIFQKQLTPDKDKIKLDSVVNFQKKFMQYLESFPDNIKLDLLYNGIQAQHAEQLASKLAEIIKELNLFDFIRIMQLLKSDNFQTQKIGLLIATFDKQFYNKEDINDLQSINKYVKETFSERGIRSMKKQLLSSKEKEVWTCECGKTNDIDSNCSGCSKDIYGFKSDEVKLASFHNYIQEKIELITEYFN